VLRSIPSSNPNSWPADKSLDITESHTYHDRFTTVFVVNRSIMDRIADVVRFSTVISRSSSTTQPGSVIVAVVTVMVAVVVDQEHLLGVVVVAMVAQESVAEGLAEVVGGQHLRWWPGSDNVA